jgi:hypothetical protein
MKKAMSHKSGSAMKALSFHEAIDRFKSFGGHNMADRKQIYGRQVVNDIRTGLGDDGLMSKYGLSKRGLELLFKRLIGLRLISHEELCSGSVLYRSRLYPRADLGLKIPIYDVTTGTRGIVRDISVKGLRVAGIPVEVGDERAFQIPVDKFMLAEPLLVVAQCRWVTIKGKKREFTVAGFELKDISATDESVLKAFIEFLLLSKSGEWQVLRESPE